MRNQAEKEGRGWEPTTMAALAVWSTLLGSRTSTKNAEAQVYFFLLFHFLLHLFSLFYLFIYLFIFYNILSFNLGNYIHFVFWNEKYFIQMQLKNITVTYFEMAAKQNRHSLINSVVSIPWSWDSLWQVFFCLCVFLLFVCVLFCVLPTVVLMVFHKLSFDFTFSCSDLQLCLLSVFLLKLHEQRHCWEFMFFLFHLIK